MFLPYLLLFSLAALLCIQEDTPPGAALLLAGGILFLALRLTRGGRPILSAPLAWVCGAMALGTASVFLAPTPYADVQLLGQWVLACIAGWAIADHGARAPESAKHTLGTGLLAIYGLLCLGVATLNGFPALQEALGRWGIPGVHATDWNMKFREMWVSMLMWPALAVMWRRQESRKAQIGGALLIVGLAAAALFQGRAVSAKIALVVGCAVFLATLAAPRLTRWSCMACLALLVLGMPLVWQQLSAQDTVALMVEKKQQGELPEIVLGKLYSRLIIWDYATSHVARHPVTGSGFGASFHLPGQRTEIRDAYPKLQNRRFRQFIYPGLHPHNLALLVWVDLGLAGALLLAGLACSLLLAPARRGWTGADLAAGTTLAFTVCLQFMVSYPVWKPDLQLILWTAAGAMAAVARAREAGRPAPAGKAKAAWALAGAIAVGGMLCLAVGHQERAMANRDALQAHLAEDGRTIVPAPDAPAVPLNTPGLGYLLAPAREGDHWLVRGWAGNAEHTAPAQRVWAFYEDKPVASAIPGDVRFDVRKAFDNNAMLFSGFTLRIAVARVAEPRSLRIVALGSGGSAGEILSPDREKE